MTVDDHTLSDHPATHPAGEAPSSRRLDAARGPGRAWRRRRPRDRRRPRAKVRKLRLLVVVIAFVVIAGISMLFGLLTSVAADLPEISNQTQFHKILSESAHSSVDSVLYDDTGTQIGILAPPNQPVIDNWSQISQSMVHAIVSVEDRSFWTDPGIDLKSIARAFISDITGGPKEGASTIAEEFVKNVLAEENNRTVFEKLREAGLAFQLVHQWTRAKILTQYLNIIYFGNGAYGIESAARIYFGKQLGYDATNPSDGTCGTATVARPHLPSCASQLRPYQAALLAGMVANPTEFDPVLHPTAAYQRRQLVLQKMLAQDYITRAQYEHATAEPLPKLNEIQQPSEPAAAPYFTAWVRPQIIRALESEGVSPTNAAYEAYYGGLKIKLTLNLQMQQAAQNIIDTEFPPGSGGPTATLVSIDNANGEVRAMVSGNGDYNASAFDLATLGYRQPGSSFKIFTLVQALESGKYGPGSIVDSAPQDIPFRQPDGEIGHFIVHNDEDSYLGPISLAEATAVSDNTVFAQVGMSVGTENVARQAHLLGIRSPVSTNPAMIIGGLTHGVSALDMAHAYETLATGGEKVYNPVLGDVDDGPIGIHSILDCGECRTKNLVNDPQAAGTEPSAAGMKQQVVPTGIVAQIHEMLAGVVSHGTGTAAAIPGVEVVGKTGTTSNYVDAWFCGWTPQLTTCVWVGYPNSGKPMSTLWNGGPVTGGTYPALIWHNYTEAALNILAEESAGGSADVTTIPLDTETAGTASAPAPATGTGTGTTTPADTTADAATVGTPAAGATGQGAETTAGTPTTAAPTPTAATPAPATTPAATTTPAPGASGGTGGTGTSGGAGLGG